MGIFSDVLRKIGLKPPRKASKRVVRRDVTVIPVGAKTQLRVYWKILPIGKGGALVLEREGREVVKYDCFGVGDGHYHFLPNYRERHFFNQTTPREQIEWSCADLSANAHRYLERADMAATTAEMTELPAAITRAKERLLYFMEFIPELR